MTLHLCADCGLAHESPGDAAPPVIPEVEIARINADRDVKVAQLAARQDKAWNETMLEETEIRADAEVAVAEVQAEAIAEVIAAEGEASVEAAGDGTPEPVIVEAPEPGPDVAPPPETDGLPATPAKKSLWPYG
jgi:hypothetical protein